MAYRGLRFEDVNGETHIYLDGVEYVPVHIAPFPTTANVSNHLRKVCRFPRSVLLRLSELHKMDESETIDAPPMFIYDGYDYQLYARFPDVAPRAKELGARYLYCPEIFVVDAGVEDLATEEIFAKIRELFTDFAQKTPSDWVYRKGELRQEVRDTVRY